MGWCIIYLVVIPMVCFDPPTLLSNSYFKVFCFKFWHITSYLNHLRLSQGYFAKVLRAITFPPALVSTLHWRFTLFLDATCISIIAKTSVIASMQMSARVIYFMLILSVLNSSTRNMNAYQSFGNLTLQIISSHKTGPIFYEREARLSKFTLKSVRKVQVVLHW